MPSANDTEAYEEMLSSLHAATIQLTYGEARVMPDDLPVSEFHQMFVPNSYWPHDTPPVFPRVGGQQ
jgi:hypothetical protein